MSIQTAFRYAVQLSAMKVAKRIRELRKAGVPRSKARKQAEREVLG
jgi:DNA-binding Lrp family transcriptional regulator